jgi:hypothetical protein
MIVIDYYNFLYQRYPEINESIILFNLNILSRFVYNKDVIIKIIFDGVFFQYINFSHKKIQLLFSSYMIADDYILKIFSGLQGRSHILISKDKTLVNLVSKKTKATIISPSMFWKELDYLIKYYDLNDKKSTLIKTTDNDDDFIDNLFKKYFDK